MAGFVHGSNATFLLSDGATASTVERDISAFVDNIEWNQIRETGETTTFGKNSKTFIPGLRTATFKVGGKFDSVVTTGPRVIFQGLLAPANDFTTVFKIRPEGTGMGLAETEGSGYVTGYTESVPVADVVIWSADVQVTGDLILTVQA